VIMDLCD